MIKAIVFDYDGVIVDSFPTVHKVYQIMCKKLGKKCPPTLAGFREQYGRSSREFMRKGSFTPAEIESADKVYLQEILKQDAPFFPGIKKIVEKLSQDYLLFLLSASPQEDVELKLKSKGMEKYFTEIIGSRKNGPIKKVPELKALLRKQNLMPEEVIMIGDRINDYEDARGAEIINIILVEYGWGYDRKKIPEHRQKVAVNKPKEILDAIKSF